MVGAQGVMGHQPVPEDLFRLMGQPEQHVPGGAGAGPVGGLQHLS